MVQRPTQYNPSRNPEEATKRRNVVLSRMFEVGMIDRAAYDEARQAQIELKIKKPRNGCVNAGNMGYFCDYISRVIENNAAFSALGETPGDRLRALYRGGLTITTTIDPALQKTAANAAARRVPMKDRSGLGAAAVTVEPGTGKVLAMAQNRVFHTKEAKGQTSVNWNTDSSYGASSGFQTGSTFKAFTLATWLARGKSLNASIDASKTSIPYSSFRSCGAPVGGGVYTFSNAVRGENRKGISVMTATSLSVNSAFVEMERQLDLCDVAKTAEKLGVHLAAPLDACGKATTKVPTCIPSMTLGPFEIAPLTMASAYAAFGAGGVYCAPRAITKIVDRDGNEVDVPGSKCSQGVSRGVASGVSLALSRVLTSGTASSIGPLPGRPTAGKTGTTNDSTHTWFVGYTAQRSTAVWVADPGRRVDGQMKRRKLQGIVVNGQYYGTVFGATLAAPIWKEIMIKAHRGLPVRGFGSTPAKLLKVEKKAIPNVAGQSVQAARATLEAAGFRTRVKKRPVPSPYPTGTVAGTSPGAGAGVAPGSEITILVSSGQRGNGNGPGNGNGGG
jgi:membrane peptidoglycan carboxypeptidase